MGHVAAGAPAGPAQQPLGLDGEPEAEGAVPFEEREGHEVRGVLDGGLVLIRGDV